MKYLIELYNKFGSLICSIESDTLEQAKEVRNGAFAYITDCDSAIIINQIKE